MNDLRDLYQEVILDHSKRPRNFRALGPPACSAEGYNPLCGDKLKLFLRVEGDVIKEATFQGAGCAISTASASMLTEAIKGKTLAEADAIFARFHGLLMTPLNDEPDTAPLGKLAAFAGVREFPLRIKCATLAWHTLRAAMEKKDEPVTTE